MIIPVVLKINISLFQRCHKSLGTIERCATINLSMNYHDGGFDFIFTNIMDHSLYPEKFIFEMERVCKTNGVIIIHLQLGKNHDKYTETILRGPGPILSLFNSSKLLVSKPISNLHDQMHWEIILKKII